MNHYQKAQFLLSVADLKQLPEDSGVEVAFCGISNVGKSSVLNRLTQQKNLARVSKSPGRTQFINLFGLDDHRRLADLPGYGFARVPDALKAQWEQNLVAYFESRDCLKGVILIMDIRHPMKELDRMLLEGCAEGGLPVHILLNKADKLTKNQLRQTEIEVKRDLEGYPGVVSFQAFSASKGEGLDELRAVLNQWYGY